MISNGAHTYCKIVLLASWPLNIRYMIAIPIKKLNVPTPTDVATSCSISCREMRNMLQRYVVLVFLSKSLLISNIDKLSAVLLLLIKR